MPSVAELWGANGIENYLASLKQRDNDRMWELNARGYVPNENYDFIDTLQGDLSGSVAGIFGDLQGYAAEHNWKWLENESKYAADTLGKVAARNQYIGTPESDGWASYVFNKGVGALASSVPSLIADVGSQVAINAAIGTVAGPEGTLLGGMTGLLGGGAKFIYRLARGAEKGVKLSKAADRAYKAGRFAIGATTGGLVENIANAGDTYRTGLSRGMDHKQAWEARNEAFAQGFLPAILDYSVDKAFRDAPIEGALGAMASKPGEKVAQKAVQEATEQAANKLGVKGAMKAAFTSKPMKAVGDVGMGMLSEGVTEAWQTQIQEQALHNPKYANTHIYNPYSWTDEMWDSAKDAAIGAGFLGTTFKAGKAIKNAVMGSPSEVKAEDITADTESEIVDTDVPTEEELAEEHLDLEGNPTPPPTVPPSAPPTNPQDTMMANAIMAQSGNAQNNQDTMMANAIMAHNAPTNVGVQPVEVNEDEFDLEAEPTSVGVEEVEDTPYPYQRAMDSFVESKKDRYLPSEMDEVIRTATAVTDEYHALWNDLGDEAKSKTSKTALQSSLKQRYLDAGLNDSDASLMAKYVGDDMKNNHDSEMFRKRASKAVAAADALGIPVTDNQRATLTSDHPDKLTLDKIEKQVENRTNEIESARKQQEAKEIARKQEERIAKQQAREAERQAKKEQAEKERQDKAAQEQKAKDDEEAKEDAEVKAYHDRFVSSGNYDYLMYLHDHDRKIAERTGRRISKAMAKRKADKADGKHAKPIRKYLSEQGIKENDEYTKNQVDKIVNHVESTEKEWDEAKDQSKGKLNFVRNKSSYRAYIEKTDEHLLKKYDSLDKRDHKYKDEVEKVHRENMEELRKLKARGFDVQKLSAYQWLPKELREELGKELYGPTNEQIAMEEYKKKTDLTKVATPTSQQVKSAEESAQKLETKQTVQEAPKEEPQESTKTKAHWDADAKIDLFKHLANDPEVGFYDFSQEDQQEQIEKVSSAYQNGEEVNLDDVTKPYRDKVIKARADEKAATEAAEKKAKADAVRAEANAIAAENDQKRRDEEVKNNHIQLVIHDKPKTEEKTTTEETTPTEDNQQTVENSGGGATSDDTVVHNEEETVEESPKTEEKPKSSKQIKRENKKKKIAGNRKKLVSEGVDAVNHAFKKEVTKEEARAKLDELLADTSLDDDGKEQIKELINTLNAGFKSDGHLNPKDRSDDAVKALLDKIAKLKSSLQNDLNQGKVTFKDYNTRLKEISKAMDDFKKLFPSYLLTEEDNPIKKVLNFEVKPPTVKAVIDGLATEKIPLEITYLRNIVKAGKTARDQVREIVERFTLGKEKVELNEGQFLRIYLSAIRQAIRYASGEIKPTKGEKDWSQDQSFRKGIAYSIGSLDTGKNYGEPQKNKASIARNEAVFGGKNPSAKHIPKTDKENMAKYAKSFWIEFNGTETVDDKKKADTEVKETVKTEPVVEKPIKETPKVEEKKPTENKVVTTKNENVVMKNGTRVSGQHKYGDFQGATPVAKKTTEAEKAIEGELFDFTFSYSDAYPDDVDNIKKYWRSEEEGGFGQLLRSVGGNIDEATGLIHHDPKNKTVTIRAPFDISNTRWKDGKYKGVYTKKSDIEHREKNLKTLLDTLDKDGQDTILFTKEDPNDVEALTNIVKRIAPEWTVADLDNNEYIIVKQSVLDSGKTLDEIALEKGTVQLYQKGKDKSGPTTKKGLARVIRSRSFADTNAPTEQEMEDLLTTIEENLGEQAQHVFNYLQNATHVFVELFDEGEACFNAATGMISLPRNKLKGTAFQHEVIHSGLKIALKQENGVERLVALADQVVKEMEETINGSGLLSSSHPPITRREGVSESTQEGNGNHSVQSVGLGENQKEYISSSSIRLHRTNDDEESSHHESSDGRGVRNRDVEGNQLRVGSLQHSTGNRQLERANQGQRQLFESQRHSAEETVKQIETKKQYQDKIASIKKKVKDVIKDEDLDPNDKSIILANDYWLARKLDEKMGDTKAIDTIYKDMKDNQNLEETLAYSMQGNLAPVSTGALLLDTKDQVEEVAKEAEANLANLVSQYTGTAIHRVDGERALEIAKDGEMLNVSMALTPTDKMYNKGVAGYGPVAIVIDPKAAWKKSEVKVVGDAYSRTKDTPDDALDEFEGRGMGDMPAEATHLLGSITAKTPTSLAEVKQLGKEKYADGSNYEDLIDTIDNALGKLLDEGENEALNKLFENEDADDADIASQMDADVYGKLLQPDGRLRYLLKPLFVMNQQGISAKEAFQQVYNKKPSKVEEKALTAILKEFQENLKIPYVEFNAGKLKIDDVVGVVLTIGEDLSEEQANKIQKEWKKRGIPVTVVKESDSMESKAQNVSTWLYNLSRNDGKNVFYQKGKEKTETKQEENKQEEKKDSNGAPDIKKDPLGHAQNVLVKGMQGMVKRITKKKRKDIEMHYREDKNGNIPGYAWKRWVMSPMKLLEKYVPGVQRLFKWLREGQREQNSLRKKYLREFFRIREYVGDKKDEFNKMAWEVTDKRRGFVEVVDVNHKDSKGNTVQAFLNITHDDEYLEFAQEKDALKRYNEFKEQGKHVYIDYNHGHWRVFASDKELKAHRSYGVMKREAKEQTRKEMKKRGYSDVVINAYEQWGNLSEAVQKDKYKYWEQAGSLESERPTRLWGYFPMIHGRYGVWKVRTMVNDRGETFEKHEKLDSYQSVQDANFFAEQLPMKDGVKYVIVEHGNRFDDATNASDIYGDPGEIYDPSKDNVLFEFENEEQREKRFRMMENSFNETRKVMDHLFATATKVNHIKFLEFMADTKKLKELGVDLKKLKEEIMTYDLMNLLKDNEYITRKNMRNHLLMNSGSKLSNRFDKKRTGAEGAHHDMFDNMETYLRYMAKRLPAQEFYRKATMFYEDLTGKNYKKTFEGQHKSYVSDTEDLLHNLISAFVGVPNSVDKKVNAVINESFIGKWVRRTFGDEFATNLMKRGMEATSVLKLGLFNPAAAIAQAGGLLNVVTYAGYNKRFFDACRDASNYEGLSYSEKKMMYLINLNLEDTGVDLQSLRDQHSLYNIKVGGVSIGKALEKSMIMFNAMDKYTRRVAALVAYRKALEEGKSKNEAIEIADEFVRKTNFDYSDLDAPQLFTKFGTLGKMILQFRKYGFKQLEFMGELFGGGDVKAMGRFLASYMVLAGLMGVPGLSSGDDLAEWMTGRKVSDRIKEAMFEWAGKDATKREMVNLAIYGMPAAAGVDMSHRVGIGDLTHISNPYGPTLSTMGELFNSIRNHESANQMVLSVGKALSPTFSNYYQGISGNKRDWTKGVDTGKYSDADRVKKVLGFRPTSESVDADVASIVNAKNKATTDKRKQLMYAYLDNPKSVSSKELKENNITKKDLAKLKESVSKNRTEKAVGSLGKKGKDSWAQDYT